jgi:hypothetical protein
MRHIILFFTFAATLLGQANKIPYVNDFPGAKATKVANKLNATFDVVADGGCLPNSVGTDNTACVNQFVDDVLAKHGPATITFPVPVAGSVYNLCGVFARPKVRFHGLGGKFRSPGFFCATGPILISDPSGDSNGFEMDGVYLSGNPYLPASMGIQLRACSECYFHHLSFNWFGGPAFQSKSRPGDSQNSNGQIERVLVTGSAQAPGFYTRLTADLDAIAATPTVAVADSSGFHTGDYLTLAGVGYESYPFEIVRVTAIPDATHLILDRHVTDPQAGWAYWNQGIGGIPGNWTTQNVTLADGVTKVSAPALYPLTAHAAGSYLATRVSWFSTHTGAIDLNNGAVDWHVAASNINSNFCPQLPGCVIDKPSFDALGEPYVAALNAQGGNLRSDKNFFAFAMTGLYTTDGLLKIEGDRFEFNQSYGAVFAGGTGGSVSGTHSYRNSLVSDGTYDGYLVRTLAASFNESQCDSLDTPKMRHCFHLKSASLTSLENSNSVTNIHSRAMTGDYIFNESTLTDYTHLITAIPPGTSHPDPYRIQMVSSADGAPGLSIGLYASAWAAPVKPTDTQAWVLNNTGFDQGGVDGSVIAVQSGEERLLICRTIGAKVIFGDPRHCPGGAVLVPTINRGVITSVTVLDPGKGYVTPPSVVVKINSGSGSGATLTAVLSGDGVGSVTVNNGGSGYSAVSVETVDGSMAGRAGPTIPVTATACAEGRHFWDGSFCHYYRPLSLPTGGYVAGTHQLNHVAAHTIGGASQIVGTNSGLSMRNTANPFKNGQNWYCAPHSDGKLDNQYDCGNDHDIWMQVHSDLKTNAVHDVTFPFPVKAPNLASVTGKPIAGQLLRFDGSNWVPYTLTAADISAALGYVPARAAGR